MKLGKSYCVKFSPDGMQLAIISGCISLWNTSTAQCVFTIKSMKDPSDVVFSPDGCLLVIKNTRGRMIVVNTKDGSVINILEKGGHEGCVPCFSTCGRFLVDGSWDGHLKVRDVSSGDLLWSKCFKGEMISSICHLADSSQWIMLHTKIATTDNESPLPGYLSFWKNTLPQLELIRTVNHNIAFIQEFNISPDNKNIAVTYGAPPDTLAVLDLDDGRILRQASTNPGGSGGGLVCSVQGIIALVEQDSVGLYKADTLERIKNLNIPYASSVDWSSDGQFLAVGSWENGFVYETKKLFK